MNAPSFRLATQCISAILLFGIAFAAGADQMMRALPGAAPAQAPAPTTKAFVVAPAGMQKLPDLAFSFVSVENRTFPVGFKAQSLVVNNFVPSVKTGVNPCGHPFTFPLQLIVKNIGQAEFVPKNSFQVVGVTIGQWNSAKDLAKLPVTASQPMNFSVSLPPGNYMLNANIDLHNGVAEARSDNNKLSWPLEVTCKVKANAMAFGPLPDIVVDGGGIMIGGKLVPFSSTTPVSVNSSSCNFPFQFSLKNMGGKGLDNFTISMKMKSESNQSLVYDGPLGGLSLAPGASYMETHNGTGLNLVSGNTYNLTVDTDFEHNKRKEPSRGHIYSVRFKPSCGPAPLGGGLKKKPVPYVQPN